MALWANRVIMEWVNSILRQNKPLGPAWLPMFFQSFITGIFNFFFYTVPEYSLLAAGYTTKIHNKQGGLWFYMENLDSETKSVPTY